MPNQLNFQIPLTTTDYTRPERYTQSDLNLLGIEPLSIVFGTNVNQIIELWVYNPDGTFAGHITLPYNDPKLSLQTLVDQNTGNISQILILDLRDSLIEMSIQPGRYALVANFFQNDVGSETGYQLYISEISSDRTELQLQLVNNTPQAVQDIFNFIVPSVPKLFAQGLLEQIFNQDPNNTNQNFVITPQGLLPILENILQGSSSKILNTQSLSTFSSLINIILQQIYNQALNLMAADTNTIQVQPYQVQSYIQNATQTVIQQLNQSGLIDKRFNVY